MNTTLIIMPIVAALAAAAMSCVVGENDNGAFKLTYEGIEEPAEQESYARESRALAGGTMGTVIVAENKNGAFKHTSDGIKEYAEKESYVTGSRGALTVTEGSMAIPAPGKFIRKALLASAVKFRKFQDQPECHTLHCVDAGGADWCYKYPGCSYCNPETFKYNYAWA